MIQIIYRISLDSITNNAYKIFYLYTSKYMSCIYWYHAKYAVALRRKFDILVCYGSLLATIYDWDFLW
jgi:hypothetical protein